MEGGFLLCILEIVWEDIVGFGFELNAVLMDWRVGEMHMNGEGTFGRADKCGGRAESLLFIIYLVKGCMHMP